MPKIKVAPEEHPLAKLARPFFNILFAVAPIVIKLGQKAWRIWHKLPYNAVTFIIGTILCFFGGFYPTTFAALQAAGHGGLKTVVSSISDLSQELLIIVEENKKDDKEDKDGDGVPDSKQVEGKEFVKRKIQLCLKKMDPEKVNNAIAALYTVWLSVLAVLKIEFARTVALALTISDFMKKPTDRFILPIMERIIPQDYQRWCPVLVGWITKSIGMSIAWKIQEVISAFTSACAGGLIMSRALLQIMSKGKKNHEETNVDEVASYVFAGLGFYWQFTHAFDAPFPLNWILWPLEVAEWYIRWAVTSED